MKNNITILLMIFTITVSIAFVGFSCSEVQIGNAFENDVFSDVSTVVASSEKFCAGIASAYVLKKDNFFEAKFALLNNFSNVPEYLLVYYDCSGYVIYHRITGEIPEINYFGDTPYECIGTKFYAGPGNYIERICHKHK